MRPLPLCAAIIPGAEPTTKAIPITVTQTRLRRARFNSRLQQKSLARIARLIAKLFLAKSIGFDWREYIPDSRRPLYPENSPVVVRMGQRRADHSGGTVADFHGLPDARASSIVA